MHTIDVIILLLSLWCAPRCISTSKLVSYYCKTFRNISDARGAFSLFDKKDTGFLPIKDLGQVFRSCAMTVDSEQLSDWLSDIGVEGINV